MCPAIKKWSGIAIAQQPGKLRPFPTVSKQRNGREMPRCHSLANHDHLYVFRSKIPARNPSPWLQIPGTKRPDYFTSMSSYALVPRPIFSPCSIMERQLVSGCVMLR